MVDDILLKHEGIVNELKKHLGSEQFDSVLYSQTAHLTKPEQFLIKMEMSRLSQPTERFIDLRGFGRGQIKLYESDGKQHFMDDAAIEVFKKALVLHGSYTLAVYEKVMSIKNDHRKLKQKENETTQTNDHNRNLDVDVVKFASYENRIEERMNYSIKVTVDYKNEKDIAANTSDISLSGCKVKLAKNYIVKKDELIALRLVGLEEDFELGLKNGIQYEVVAVEKTTKDFNYIRLKRTYIENNKSFDAFLEKFINANKRRYKVNLDNTLDAVVSKGYEQYYIPRVASLYIFLSKNNDALIPTLTLTNENNIFIQRYFTDEKKVVCLYSVLNHERISSLLRQPTAVKEDYLYTFTHVSAGKVYYYSATRSELNKTPHFKDLFLGFGSKKESFKCFKIQIMPSHADDSYIPLSLPNTLGKNIEKLNKRPSARVQSFLIDVKYLVVLTNIGSEAEIKNYQRLNFEPALIPHLKSFGHAKKSAAPNLTEVALEYINLRASKRYLYKTTVEVDFGDSVITGHTLDFSIMGLQLEFADSVTFKKGDSVLLSFVELQRITKKHSLNQLAYEVMAISKSAKVVNLKAISTDNPTHTGITFFTQLIENNQDKLKVSEEKQITPGLALALRNMVTKTICQFPFYLNKEAAHFKIGAVGFGLYASPLHVILQSFRLLDKKTDLSSILTKDHVVSVITPNIKNRSRQDPPLAFTLVVNLDPRQNNIEDAITSQCTLGKDYSHFYKQISYGIKSQLVFVLRVYISRTGRPDTNYLANELKYVSQYAIHKAKDLEDALWSVAGVGDIVDISEEALGHLNLDQQEVDQMGRRKLIWLNRSH